MPPEQPSVRLILIRHGQAGGPGISYGAEAPLTAQGRKQAERVAAELARDRIDAIFSSPYTRAVETARPTRERLGCAYAEDPRLVEFQMGDDGAAAIAEIIATRRHLALWRPHDQLAHDGETLGQFHARVAEFLTGVAERHLGATVAVFSHAGAIAAAMRWAYGLSSQHDWHTIVEPFNASLTEIRHWPQGRHPDGAPYASTVLRLNDVRHLPPELVTLY